MMITDADIIIRLERIERLLQAIVPQPQQERTGVSPALIAEINAVKVSGGDLAQHFKARYKAGQAAKKKEARS
jgi:hypothetical protein